jgi:hypothetical protein
MKIIKTVFLLFILFSFSVEVFAVSFRVKVPAELIALEDSMNKFTNAIQKGKTDEERYFANDQFKNFLEAALGFQESFDYPFDSLKTIAKLVSPDKQIRIYNWLLPKLDGTFEYFGYLQKKVGRKKYKIYPLIDKSEDLKTAEYKILSNYQWYGALYYKIIQPKKRVKQYTLLAWDGNDKLSNKKLIDVLMFDTKEEPKFGATIFKTDKKNQSRILFEFNKDVSMSMRYYEKTKTIIYDHLEPSYPQLEGQYQFYGPDFTYDSFKFDKGTWIMVKDVQPLNTKSSKDKVYNAPK